MMKRKHAWITVLMSVALMLGFAGTSMADTLIFTVFEQGPGGNDKEATIESDWNTLGFGSIDLEFYAKVEGNSGTSGGLDISTSDGGYNGSWETDDPIQYYSVKASSGYALYEVDQNDDPTKGIWTTADLITGGSQQPTVSHITAWTAVGGSPPPPGPGNNPVPEPSTVFLMGFGLVGMGVVYRKRSGK